jgi:hypothetical protein
MGKMIHDKGIFFRKAELERRSAQAAAYSSVLTLQKDDNRLAPSERKVAEDDLDVTKRQQSELEQQLHELDLQIGIEEEKQSELRVLIAESEDQNK